MTRFTLSLYIKSLLFDQDKTFGWERSEEEDGDGLRKEVKGIMAFQFVCLFICLKNVSGIKSIVTSTKSSVGSILGCPWHHRLTTIHSTHNTLQSFNYLFWACFGTTPFVDTYTRIDSNEHSQPASRLTKLLIPGLGPNSVGISVHQPLS